MPLSEQYEKLVEPDVFVSSHFEIKTRKAGYFGFCENRFGVGFVQIIGGNAATSMNHHLFKLT